MSQTTIKLKTPIVWNDALVAELTVREPMGREYLRLGEPFNVVPMPGGQFTVVEDPEKILAYVEACITHAAGKAIVHLMSLADGLQIKAAMLDFFTKAHAPPAAEVSAEG